MGLAQRGIVHTFTRVVVLGACLFVAHSKLEGTLVAAPCTRAKWAIPTSSAYTTYCPTHIAVAGTAILDRGAEFCRCKCLPFFVLLSINIYVVYFYLY